MRRCLVHHPRRYAGARPVRLRNDDELDAAIGESPDYQYGLAAPGMERIVDPPLDRVFVGSLSLFRAVMESRGRTFLQEIRDAIEGVDRVIAVVGPKAISSEYVRYEWDDALLFAKGIVPI